MQGTYKDIFSELMKIPAIDTHEHLRFGHMIDFVTLHDNPLPFHVDLRKVILGSYMGDILKVAAAAFESDNLDDRSSLLSALRASANTSSYRCGLEIPLRDLYDFDVKTLNESTWDSLEAEIADRYKLGPWQWTADVLRQANIAKVLKINVSPSYYQEILPSLPAADRHIEQQLFTGVGATDTFILHKPDSSQNSPTQQGYCRLADRYGITLDKFEGFLSLIDKVIQTYRSLGVCALKSAAAYERGLRVEPVSIQEAGKLYCKPNKDMTPQEQKSFSDFIWIEIARLAARYELPFVIHTGLVPGRGGDLLTECNPALMKGLLNNPELSQTKFVLIHTGYPYARESVHIAWDLPNVWIDFVWLPTLSIEASVSILGEFLDWVPANKFLLGGDFELPEGVYGAMYQSREVLAMVLARKVRWGIWSIGQAIDIASQVLRENAIRLFKL